MAHSKKLTVKGTQNMLSFQGLNASADVIYKANAECTIKPLDHFLGYSKLFDYMDNLKLMNPTMRFEIFPPTGEFSYILR